MKAVFLDGAACPERADVFRAFEKALDLPVGTGRNLDALHDVLTERRDEIGVVALNFESLEERFPAFAEAFLKLMKELKKSRPGFFFTRSPFGKRGKK